MEEQLLRSRFGKEMNGITLPFGLSILVRPSQVFNVQFFSPPYLFLIFPSKRTAHTVFTVLVLSASPSSSSSCSFPKSHFYIRSFPTSYSRFCSLSTLSSPIPFPSLPAVPPFPLSLPLPLPIPFGRSSDPFIEQCLLLPLLLLARLVDGLNSPEPYLESESWLDLVIR